MVENAGTRGGLSDFRNRSRGVLTALITPFSEDGKTIDYGSVDALLEQQANAGVKGLVIAGSTGEAATLSDVEYGALIRYVVDRSEGKFLCIAGVNASSTARGVELALRACSSGADGLLVVTPPYNKPTQAGIIKHFEEIAHAAQRPVVAYNIPGRAVSSLTPQTLATLASDKVIVGLKESSGSLDVCLDFFAVSSPDFSVFAGDDSFSLAVLVHGGNGIISACANAAPATFVRLSEAALSGNIVEARTTQFELLPLIRALFTETNPIPVKAALQLKGIIKHSTVRLPLIPAQKTTVTLLEELFAKRAFE